MATTKRKPARAKRAARQPAAAGKGERLARTEIALRAGIDRETVTKYLRMPGAPAADHGGRYSYRDALAWIEKKAPRAMGGGENLGKLREQGLKLKNELASLDLAIRRSEFVEKRRIQPAVLAFCKQLTDDLRAKFEYELPGKYDGRSVAEKRQLNAEAIDWVLTRLKAGAAPIAEA